VNSTRGTETRTCRGEDQAGEVAGAKAVVVISVAGVGVAAEWHAPGAGEVAGAGRRLGEEVPEEEGQRDVLGVGGDGGSHGRNGWITSRYSLGLLDSFAVWPDAASGKWGGICRRSFLGARV
jgi:hypothetical protein